VRTAQEGQHAAVGRKRGRTDGVGVVGDLLPVGDWHQGISWPERDRKRRGKHRYRGHTADERPQLASHVESRMRCGDRPRLRVAPDAFQIRAQFGGALVPQIAVSFERFVDNGVEFRQQIWIHSGRWDDRAAQDSR
jgi:hypothetical protein